MELRHLRYFIRAAELLNFTKAAESLYVSQPTLSVQIHQLEQELGSELFARVGRNVRLTEAGKVFLSRANRAVKELEEGGKEVDAIKGLVRGSVTIAALPLFASRFLPGWMALFNERYPDVTVTVGAGTSEYIEDALIAGTADLGVALMPVQHPDIFSTELNVDQIVLVVPRSHDLAKKKKVTVADFKDCPMALPSARISATKLLADYFELNGFQPNVTLVFEEGHGLIEMVKRGKFITLLPGWCVDDNADLCTFPLPAPGIPITNGIMWTNLTPAAKALLDLITEQMKQTQGAAR